MKWRPIFSPTPSGAEASGKPSGSLRYPSSASLPCMGLIRRSAPQAMPADWRFEVTAAPGLIREERDGRLLIVIGTRESPEPRRGLGVIGPEGPTVLGRDVAKFGPGGAVVVNGKAVAFPVSNLAQMPGADYWVQAVFHHDRDLRILNGPGTLYSEPIRVAPRPGPWRDRRVGVEPSSSGDQPERRRKDPVRRDSIRTPERVPQPADQAAGRGPAPAQLRQGA